MADRHQEIRESVLVDRITAVEMRLRRIEERLGLPVSANIPTGTALPAASVDESDVSAGRSRETSGAELEFEVGQSWFAKIGIFVLAIGIAVTLSRPFPSLPPVLPSLIGFALVGVLSVLAHLGRRSFEMLSTYLLGAAMALAAFSAFRLFFFGADPVFETDSITGRTLLLAVAAINLVVAVRRQSANFTGLSLLIACMVAALIPSAWFSVSLIVVICACAAVLAVRFSWPALLTMVTPLAYASYLAWVFQQRLADADHGVIREPGAQLFLVVAYALVLAGGSLFRRDRSSENQITVLNAVLNCGAGYLTFVFHAFAASSGTFVISNFAAACVYLGIAITFWVREQSQISTFFYAMTGYLAVTAGIIQAFGQPEVFVWLSIQSVLVVFTAVWFRSRFIVVANFLIFLAIVGSYVVTTRTESGVSLVFGIVAFATARFLNWKKSNLELKTEFMRNAYLITAFALFPYALYHLLPRIYVSLAWIGIALLYYLFSHLIGIRKYRWMGHGTLLLTAVYLVAVGIQHLEPTLRSISLLALGIVLLAVSVVFTIVRSRQRSAAPDAADDVKPPEQTTR